MAGIQVIDPSTFDLSGTIGKMGQDLSIIADPQGHRLAQLRELFISNPKVAESAATMFKINPDAASKFFGVKSDAFGPMMQAVTPDPLALATHTALNTPGFMEKLQEVFQSQGGALMMVNPELAKEHYKVEQDAVAAKAKVETDRETARIHEDQMQKNREAQARIEQGLGKWAASTTASTPVSPITGKNRSQEVDDIQSRKNRINDLITKLDTLAPETRSKGGTVKVVEPQKAFWDRRLTMIRQIRREVADATKLYPGEEWQSVRMLPTALPGKELNKPVEEGTLAKPADKIPAKIHEVITIPGTGIRTPVKGGAPVAPVSAPPISTLSDDQKFTTIDTAITTGKMNYEALLSDPEYPNLPDSVKQKLKDKYAK